MKIKLPIDQYEEAIVKAIAKNDFLIVVGKTGCGKTTRIPQFLAGKFAQVIVTEPRILTAKTASHRVAEEMGVTVGKEIGYKTGYDKCFSADSKILFCTDGLQLVRTITMADGTKENVLIIDEIHLWNRNMEALVAWCKFMRNKWNTKVVIMSATMDAEKLKSYLGSKTEIINVPGRLYEVAVEHRPAYMLVPTVLEYVKENRDTIVFVSGKKEMESLIEDIKEENCNAVILPLHGDLEWEEQNKCYQNYSVPKVIVATNIAQDGVTIPGISVIDTGKAKISNAESGVEGLVEIEISKADCKQREGRAGRTEGGRYTLCSDYPYEDREEYTVPEIQRSILDRIVLQLAAAGLDAEMLEFYHQPDIEAIRLAKKKLIALGATDSDNNVTELGTKMVKMPVSVELARMIVEAEKYGVTEQVMTIAAIIEMGGLLKKGKKYSWVDYSNFTHEHGSDLLAELDVWNKLSEMGYIDFNEVGISKKNFLRIKEHIKKLKNALDNLVDIQNNDDREAIVKSCIAGMATNIFVSDGYGRFVGEDGVIRQLDRNSCVHATYSEPLYCVVGTPRSFPVKVRWGFTEQMNLVTFATRISKSTLEKLVAPSQISVKIENRYDAENDAVMVCKTRSYLDLELNTDFELDYNHPEYATLKAEYDAEQEWLRSLRTSSSSYERRIADTRQQTVMVDGKEFDVHYCYNKPCIYVDDKTLFTTDVRTVALDNGTRVMLRNDNVYRREEESMAGLRNAVENQRLTAIRDCKKRYYARIQVATLWDVLSYADEIGTIELTMNNGGYGDEPVLAYGCVTLKKKTVSFELLDDEEKATSNTREALQYLFMKEVEKRYPIGSFSSQTGKKKKILTPKENEVKMEFDTLVRELLSGLTVDNAEEDLEFLEEYFQEITENIQKAS
ncbi:helicase-related protein [Lactococcus sp. UBA7157]|uniref:helicase-related protein n=1 Tax=Lactococcus sp. UBA7157 TaxID=1946734 RepID=UPI002580686F|nr:helicase-related protein [Lactococcus sp. UBA7157]